MEGNRIENVMDVTGRVSFDPRTIGSKGAKSYDISFFAGPGSKGSSMEGKTEYVYVTVYDWDNLCSDDIKKGDFIRAYGTIRKNRYRTKTGEERENLVINAKKLKKVDNPFYGSSGRNRDDKKDDEFPDLF